MNFRNEVQASNAQKVRTSRSWEEEGRVMYANGDTLVCHEFLEDGRYQTLYFKDDLNAVAEWVCSSRKDKLICNGSDYAVASTIGVDLDLCVESFRRAFFEVFTECQIRHGLHAKEEL